jgi:hypothetical protein
VNKDINFRRGENEGSKVEKERLTTDKEGSGRKKRRKEYDICEINI